jgi:hypothetical protein
MYNGSGGGGEGLPTQFCCSCAFFRLITFYWPAECMSLIAAERETAAAATRKMRIAVTDDRLQIANVLLQRQIIEV